jgi:hypothetical protein
LAPSNVSDTKVTGDVNASPLHRQFSLGRLGKV